MKCVVLATLLAGCLAEPPSPPGHDHELRPRAHVAKLDADDYEDLVLIGHDGDPHDDAYVWVYWGDANAPFAQVTRRALKQNAAAFYEPLDIGDLHGGSAGAELAIMTAEDPNLPYDTTGRTITLAHFPIDLTGRDLGVPTVATPTRADFGGYADDLPNTFVYERGVGTATDFETVFGGGVSLYWQHGSAPTVDGAMYVDLPPTETVTSAVAMQPDVYGQEGVLVTTEQHVFITDSDGPVIRFDPSHVIALPSAAGPHLVRERQILQSQYLAIRDEADQQVTLVRFNFFTMNAVAFASHTIDVEAQPIDVGVLDNPQAATVDMVTIQGARLVVYPGVRVDGTPGTPGPPYSLPLSSDGYDLLAIGHFSDGGDRVYVIDRHDPHRPFACFVAAGTQLAPCS